MAANTYKFGVAMPVGSYVGWLVESVSHNFNAEEAIARDNNGEPVAAHYYGKTEEISITVTVPEGETIPATGVVFDWGGVAFYCTSASMQESNTDFNKYTINAKRFIANSLPEESSSGA